MSQCYARHIRAFSFQFYSCLSFDHFSLTRQTGKQIESSLTDFVFFLDNMRVEHRSQHIVLSGAQTAYR